MLGILVPLALSWLLLYVVEKQSILALGVLPVALRLRQFLVGMLITGLICAGYQGALTLYTGLEWEWNPTFGWRSLAALVWWDLKSVLTEELVFRGALLCILIKRLGKNWGIALSALGFGIYHWFSYGIWGQPMPMLVVLLGTGTMGAAFAIAFSKSRSILLPIGLHLGWNVVYNSVFSHGPVGPGLLLSKSGSTLSESAQTLHTLMGMIGVPLLVLAIVAVVRWGKR